MKTNFRHILFVLVLLINPGLTYAGTAGSLLGRVKSLFTHSAKTQTLPADEAKYSQYQEVLNNIDQNCRRDCKSTIEDLERFNSKYPNLDNELAKSTKSTSPNELPLNLEDAIVRLENLFNRNNDSLKVRIKSSFEGLKALFNLEKEHLKTMSTWDVLNRNSQTQSLHEDSKYLFKQLQSLYKIHQIIKNQGQTIKLSDRDAREIIQAINGLGLTYVKLAQTITSVTDVIPEPLARALKGLNAENTELSPEQARSILQRELGKDPFQVFKNLDFQRPLARGTTSYIYSAEVQGPDGKWKEVVVKVQRPDLENSLNKSQRFQGSYMNFIQAAVPHINLSPALDIVADTIIGVENSIQQQLDFRREAKNLEKFSEYFKNNKQVQIPKVYTDLSSSKVLVLEKISGETLDVNISKIMTSLQQKNYNMKSPEGKSIERIFSALLQNVAYMALITKEVHGDLRPENIISTLHSDEKGLSIDPKITLIDPATPVHLNGLLTPLAGAGMNLLLGDSAGFAKRLLQIGSASELTQSELLQIIDKHFKQNGIQKIDALSFLKRKGRLNNISTLQPAVLGIVAELVNQHNFKPDTRYIEAFRAITPVGLSLWTLGKRLDGLTLAKASLAAFSKGVVLGSLNYYPKFWATKAKTVFFAPKCGAIFN